MTEEEFIKKWGQWLSTCLRDRLVSEMKSDLESYHQSQLKNHGDIPDVVDQLACKCDRPDPYTLMPNKCFRCKEKIVAS